MRAAVIAGACGTGSFPANTVEAARACLDLPVDGIEVDAHLSADGRVVVHHDYRLDPDVTRLDGAWIEGPGARIGDLSLDQLQAYEVGRTRPGSTAATDYPHRAQWDGVRIPTLEAIFAALAGAAPRRPTVYVEIKTDPQRPDESSDPEALTRAVIAVVKAAGWGDQTRLIAFDWRVLRLCRALAPHLATGHLVIPRFLAPQVRRDAAGRSPWLDGCDPERFGGDLARGVAGHGGQELAVFFRDIDAALVRQAAVQGLSVAAWGLTAPADVAAMLDLGVRSVTAHGPFWGPFQ